MSTIPEYQYQRIYFSDDLSLMIEKSHHFNMTLSQRVDALDGSRTVTWKPLRKFINQASDLSEFSVFNYMFSPNLELYVDSEKSSDSYTIKKTIDDSVLLKIPSGVTCPSLDHPSELIKKFRWDSNNRFRFINYENMEKLYQIDFNDLSLTQIGYGRIPFLD